MGYISENFELNIETTRKFEPFRFNEFWMNYRRTSGAFAVKCRGDRLYTSRLRSLWKGYNFIIITEEDMQEGVYDDDFLKFPFQLELGHFKRTPVIDKKFNELIWKKKKDKHHYRQLESYHLEDRCKVRILSTSYFKKLPTSLIIVLLCLQ